MLAAHATQVPHTLLIILAGALSLVTLGGLGRLVRRRTDASVDPRYNTNGFAWTEREWKNRNW